MNYHRLSPEGRYLGIVQSDEPRADLTEDQPPDAPDGYVPFRVDGAWVLRVDPDLEPAPQPPTLEEAKAAKWAQIKAARDLQELAPFACNGAVFDADPVSFRRINGAVTMALIANSMGAPFALDWTTADNSTVPLDAMGMIGVGLALGEQSRLAHAHAAGLRATIAAAATPEEVAAVTW